MIGINEKLMSCVAVVIYSVAYFMWHDQYHLHLKDDSLDPPLQIQCLGQTNTMFSFRRAISISSLKLPTCALLKTTSSLTNMHNSM